MHYLDVMYAVFYAFAGVQLPPKLDKRLMDDLKEKQTGGRFKNANPIPFNSLVSIITLQRVVRKWLKRSAEVTAPIYIDIMEDSDDADIKSKKQIPSLKNSLLILNSFNGKEDPLATPTM
eukprot:NODE_5092_length_1068_cov_61.003175_g4536_i0.p1 GENE.NODE_5092_length_1068_cov_61.003175_g4536_i0~~NODE_5092_length_1068_cov_61.003175_g4536_i0.p1  ORF type:complete len:120 (+),score=21.90 NODE_5092_length_1068_cov_61.003175_g4536_i0:460-819(+)